MSNQDRENWDQFKEQVRKVFREPDSFSIQSDFQQLFYLQLIVLAFSSLEIEKPKLFYQSFVEKLHQEERSDDIQLPIWIGDHLFSLKEIASFQLKTLIRQELDSFPTSIQQLKELIYIEQTYYGS